MRQIALAVALIVVVALVSPIFGPFLIYPLVVPVLAPVLPRPPGVPKGADAQHNWKAGGLSWHWSHRLPHGCVAWYAQRSFALVSLTRQRTECDPYGGELSYLSFEDSLRFTHCAASPSDLAAFQELSGEATRAAKTAGERAVLYRVVERLQAVGRNTLTADDYRGCSDLKPEDYSRPRTKRLDVWRSPAEQPSA